MTNDVGGLGLFSMQERPAHVGATLDIDSKRGEGTRIQVTLPGLL